MFHTLNPLTIPISDTNLIEASAGTGKTWNIAALFTRLIVLEHHRIDRILVVTFTKAATAELKNRLRARLDDALQILNRTPNAAQHLTQLQQNCQGDDFLYQLLQQALAQEPQNRLHLRLKAAISDFDNAAIYTIHGFCQRVLQDFAFLCQVPFDIQLDETSADEQQLLAAQDFWRTHIAHHPQWADLAHRHRLNPQNQLATLRPFLARPYLPFRQPEPSAHAPYAVLLQQLHTTWQHIHANLETIEAAFWAIHPNLNGQSYQTKTYQQKFATLRTLTHPNPNTLRTILYNSNGSYQPFAAEIMLNKTKKNKTLDKEHLQTVSQLNKLTELSDQIIIAETELLHQLHTDLCTYLREQRIAYKKHHPTRVFDDLLLDVHTALLHNPEHADALAQAIAHNWQVALIDEFQDTDPLQYAIFRTAFAHTPLFLVGDPKQAIYSFRGADIFAYLQAAQESQHHYTLNTNRRSHHRLMNSISAFFQREHPFVLPEIEYTPVAAARPTSALQPSGHAVQVRWLPNHDHLKTDALVQQSAQICAEQIADLLKQSLSGSLNIHGKPLHAGQIAVLVRARQDGAVMQRALKKQGIQSVLLSQDSIFAEDEAQALAALLEFVIQPQKTGVLRFVLASVLFGYDAQALNELNHDEHQLLVWIHSANRTLEKWQKQGIYPALQAFLREHDVETRLLRQQNERALTNIHQIMELLAQEDELSHTPSSLHQWLNRHIQAATKQHTHHNHHILRLESDEQLVKIVTMHAAKGLQYPIVFCPFVWKASASQHQQKWLISHQSGHAEIISKHQYKQSDADQTAIMQAQLSEDIRLLYVAMTRAEERLYLYLSHFEGAKSSTTMPFKNAFAYLLNADDNITKNAQSYQQHWQQFIAQHTSPETDFEFIIHHDEQTHSGSLNLQHYITKPHYQAHHIPKRHFQFIQHASFTSLSRQTTRAHEATELRPTLDADEQYPTPPAIAPTDDADSIHAFPQGVAAGICLHSILEKWQFHQSSASQLTLIDEQLTRHGFDANIWRSAVMQMCDFASQTPLRPHLNLAHVDKQQTISEMSFLFHTPSFTLADIQAWFANPKHKLPKHMIQAAQQWQFRDVHGFLNGAIDLIVQTKNGNTFIIDYKSNYLGSNAEAYTTTALEQVMAEHHYYLQAFIYAIATARYLHTRHALPKTLSIRYLFLRGLDGITENGVWTWEIHTADLAPWLSLPAA